MGKIVKYCAACEESFAEKFAFCPNCGQAMTAFEMNPVAAETQPVISEMKNNVAEEKYSAEPPPVTESFKSTPVVEEAPVGQTIAFSAGQTQAFSVEDKSEIYDEVMATDEPVEEVFTPEETISVTQEPVETKTFAAAAGANGNGNFHQTANYDYQETPTVKADDFHITLVEEKNVKQRNSLLLGTMAIMLMLFLGGTVYSLFSKELNIGAIDQEMGIFVPIVDDEPMAIEEEEPPKKNEEEGGGGGGGGRDKPTPTSKGQLATQTEKPMIAPTVTLVKKDFELKYQASTQGTRQIKQTDEPYGDPNSKYTLSSDGIGSGGGQGSGIGTGQGSGRGTGQGSGIGSGSGSGIGTGQGGGTGGGSGNNLPKPPPPPKPVEVVTVPFRIISKPRATYTDAARQNQVTGVVRLRVTFSASGAIGSISPVSGLPYGLTEQAISAARAIKFEPAKKNGVAVASTKIIEYSFTIY